MRTCSCYALAHTDSRTGKATLTREGKTLPDVFEGVFLEAQFTLKQNLSLVFLSDDDPYDAGLHIYLLSEDGSTLDALEAGVAYASGIFKIKQYGDTWIEFEFFTNDTVYKITNLEKPQFQFSLPTGWKYKHFLQKHWLLLEQL